MIAALIAFAALATAPLAAGPLQGVILTKEQAAKATSAELGRRLLPPSYPVIVKAIVHPFGMEAPYASLTGLDLYSEGVKGGNGFCSAQIYRIKFSAVGAPREAMFRSSPMQATSLEVDNILRLIPGRDYPNADCNPGRQLFFSSTFADVEFQMEVVRLLAAAKGLAETRAVIPFDYRFIDEMPPTVMAKLTSAQALASLPVDQIFSVRELHDGDLPWSIPKEAQTGIEAKGRRAEIYMGMISVYMALAGGRIEHLVVVRAIPAPF